MSAGALLDELRERGVRLKADGLTLRVDAPEEVDTDELRAALCEHKRALIRLLKRERKRLEEADRRGLVIRWSKEPGWISLHDPTTGEWHEVKASECPPPSWSRRRLTAVGARRGRTDERLRAGGARAEACPSPVPGALRPGTRAVGRGRPRRALELPSARQRLCSLSPSHADRVVRRVRENEVGLARILLAGPWTPDLEAIREEGSPC